MNSVSYSCECIITYFRAICLCPRCNCLIAEAVGGTGNQLESSIKITTHQTVDSMLDAKADTNQHVRLES